MITTQNFLILFANFLLLVLQHIKGENLKLFVRNEEEQRRL